MSDWRPGRWWRVVDSQGELWAETSDPDEARASMRPGDYLFREWIRDDREWRVAE